MKSTMTRRDFLKVSGISAIGAAALSLAACAKKDVTAAPNGSDVGVREDSKEVAGEKFESVGEGATVETEGRGDSDEGSVAGKDGKVTLLNFCANKVKDLNPFAQRVPAAPI